MRGLILVLAASGCQGDPCDHDEDDDNFDDFVDWCPYDPGPDRGCPREDIPTTGCGGPRFN